MRKTLPLQILGALLALCAGLPATAQTLNVVPATWRTNVGFGFPSCQAALDASLDWYRTFWGDPLVLINGSSCTNAVEISPGPPPDYRLEWRRTNQEPATPNHASSMSPGCPPGTTGPLHNSSRGWHCTIDTVLSNFGTCPTGTCPQGNPINAGFGNKYQSELDYEGVGPFPLRLERMHNSALGQAMNNFAAFGVSTTDGQTGSNWTHNYERRLRGGGPTVGNNPQAPVASYNTAAVTRPDGKQYAFRLEGGVWTPDVQFKGERLEKLVSGWKLTTSEDEVETYDEAGQLVSIANRAGLTQTLAYVQSGFSKGLLQSVTDAFGRTLTFSYDNNRQLVSVTMGFPRFPGHFR
jgi:YD repeat-containing protein